MSNFAHQFEAFKKERRLTASQISKQTGIDNATLSRLKAAARNITFDELRNLCRVYADYAPLFLASRLMDELHGVGGDKVTIGISGSPKKKLTHHHDLPPGFDKAIHRISAQGRRDPKLRNTIIWIGDHCQPLEANSDAKAVQMVGDESVSEFAPATIAQNPPNRQAKETTSHHRK